MQCGFISIELDCTEAVPHLSQYSNYICFLVNATIHFSSTLEVKKIFTARHWLISIETVTNNTFIRAAYTRKSVTTQEFYEIYHKFNKTNLPIYWSA